MANSAAAVAPKPPPGFVPEQQASAIPPPPPGFVPEEQAGPNIEARAAANPPTAPFKPPWMPGLTKQQEQAKGAYESANLKPIGETLGSMGGAAMFPIIKGAGIVKNLLPFLGRVAGSSAGMGTGALAGGAGPQEAKGATEAGAIAQPFAEALSASLPWLGGRLKGMATTQYEKALAPTTKANKAIASKIAPELIQRGEFGSLQGLEQTAKEQAGNLKTPLDTAYAATPATATAGSGTQIVQDLENLKGKYIVNGQPASPSAVNAISGVQDIVKQYGADIDPNSLRKLKSIFDDPVAARGGYAGGDLSTAYTLKAQKIAANSIRDIMGKASPDVAALNKEISFWLNVQKVTSATTLRQAGQAGGLMNVLSPMAGAVAGSAGYAAGGSHMGLETAAAASLSTLAVQVIRSPLWRTVSAVTKDRLADALARGDVGLVTALAAKFGVATASAKGQAPPGN